MRLIALIRPSHSSNSAPMFKRLIPLTTLLLSACAIAPEAPQLAAPSAARGSFVGSRSTDGDIGEHPVPNAWWKLFEDAALDRQIAKAIAANLDLRVALANLDVARAVEHQGGAARLPATVIESGAGPERADKQPSTSSVAKSGYELGATVAYEIDLFGRLRYAALAATADAEATAAALESARLAVVADTVSAYVDFCGASAATALAEQQLQLQQRSLELVDRQLEQGEVSPLELAQARGALETARTALPAPRADRQRAAFRLAALQGLPPAAAESLALDCTAVPAIRQALPVGDGTGLIARRPDIRQAGYRLNAATARIGVASAELYPRISLGGSAGLIGGGFDAVLTPLISWSFPNQTLARARIDAAKGTATSALAQWDATVLRALGEVENALADYRAETQRRQPLAAALVQATEAVRLAQARYRLGAENYLVVLDAERRRNDLSQQTLDSNLRLARSQIALFRALGGGWQPEAVIGDVADSSE
jgi:NodT family efflux transporter outer membrane factor (OMF) lipoprotein